MRDSFNITFDSPEFKLERAEGKSRCTLTFSRDGSSVAIELKAPALEALIHQAQTILPSPRPVLTTPEIAESWRKAAWPLQRLDSGAWQLLMREISSDDLAYLLWFLKDRSLAANVMNSMTPRAASKLLDDLSYQFQGKDPDTAEPWAAEAGCAAIEKTLSMLSRLMDENQIPRQ